MSKFARKKRRRILMRRKRTLDPNIVIDYKKPDGLKRFITDRGKIIPRRISGATSEQQRAITTAIKRARYLGLLPYSVAHRPERGFAGEMAAVNAAAYRDPRRDMNRDRDRDRDRDRKESRPEGGDSEAAKAPEASAASSETPSES